MPRLTQAGGRHSHPGGKSTWMSAHHGGSEGLVGHHDTTVLPEHESKWPATDAVTAAITAEWDGTAGGARDLGQRHHSPVDGSTYPSWRIADIAQQIGVYAAKVAARAAANFDALYPEPRVPPTLLAKAEAKRWTEDPHPPTGITTIEGALARVEQQLADGDGDTTILTIQREALREIAAERPQTTQAVRRDEGRAMETETITETNELLDVAGETTRETRPEVKPRQGDTRDESCAQCDKTFTSTYYSPSGWTRYCSRACLGAARSIAAKQQHAARATKAVESRVEREPERERRPHASPSGPAPSIAQIVTPPASVHLHLATPDPLPAPPALGILDAIVRLLPAARSWTTGERTRWVALFAAGLDYEITVTDEDEGE